MISTANEYIYPLPECYREVAVTAMAMALLDLVQEAPLRGERSIKDRVWYHCENILQKYRERDLTNDYPGYVCLFHAWYAFLYQHEEQGIAVPIKHLHEVARREISQNAKLIEVKRFCTAMFFPIQHDESQVMAIYRNIVITSHKTDGGYYASFVTDLAVHRTQVASASRQAILLAQQMIDGYTYENCSK